MELKRVREQASAQLNALKHEAQRQEDNEHVDRLKEQLTQAKERNETLTEGLNEVK